MRFGNSESHPPPKNGNITRITNDNATILYQYEYDNLGQLVREDNYGKGYSYTYTYDFAGNIQTKKTYAFSTDTLGAVISTKNYTYGNSSWGDLLTNYYGDEIGYDEIGNPIFVGTYDSGSDIWYSGYAMEWSGRQLTSYNTTFMYDEGEMLYCGSLITFEYNADGIRTSKTVDGIEHKYYLNGSQILAETWKQGNVEHLLIFVYDENDSPIALKYRTNAYAENTFDFFFYEKNLQGDIIGIFNTNGRRVGWYIYDAWGTCSTYVASSTSTLEQSIVRSYNPYRYRGYYYDTETQLYYLQSRYYNPQWGRFLNADACLYSNLLGFNLFAYCYNNPVNYYDPTGENATVVDAWVGLGWLITLIDGPLPVGDILYWGSIALLTIGAASFANEVAGAIDEDANDNTQPPPPDNFPDEEKVEVDMAHIMNEHDPNNGKKPHKDKFARWMTKEEIEKLVRKGYKNAMDNYPSSIEKMQPEINPTIFRLKGKADNQTIELWIDIVKKMITTAYPK